MPAKKMPEGSHVAPIAMYPQFLSDSKVISQCIARLILFSDKKLIIDIINETGLYI